MHILKSNYKIYKKETIKSILIALKRKIKKKKLKRIAENIVFMIDIFSSSLRQYIYK